MTSKHHAEYVATSCIQIFWLYFRILSCFEFITFYNYNNQALVPKIAFW